MPFNDPARPPGNPTLTELIDCCPSSRDTVVDNDDRPPALTSLTPECRAGVKGRVSGL
jgi:hypothetical protein